MAAPTQFVGVQAPWHNTWKPLPDEARKDYKLAMQLSGLDMQIITKPLIDPFTLEKTDVYGIYSERMMDGELKRSLLSTATERYVPHSIEKSFAFIQDLNANGAEIDSCGYLGNGETVFINMIVGQAEVVKGDTHTMFMQSVIGNDKKRCREFFQTDLRMVCSNTVAYALQLAGFRLKFRATKHDEQRLDNAGEFLKLVGKQNESFVDKLKYLSEKRMTAELQEQFFNRLFPKSADAEGSGREARKIFQIIRQDASNGVRGIEGTLYGAFNQLTAFVDHVGNPKKKLSAGENEARRAVYSQFGLGAKLKQDGLNILTELANVAPSNKVAGVIVPRYEIDTENAPLVSAIAA